MRKRKPPDEKNQTPQGNQSQTGQGDGGDAPKYVTEEQLNRAISARLGDFSKKFEKTLETTVSTITSKVEEMFTKQQQPPPGGEGGSGGDPKAIENHPIVKGLQKQLADTKTLVDQTRADRDAEKSKARDTTLRTRVQEALTKGGLDPKFVGHAVGHLVDTSKRVRFTDDDSDELVFRDGTTDVDFDTGMKGWLKTDDAKLYLPPRGTQGSGDRPGSRPGSSGTPAPTVGGVLLGMVRQSQGGGPNE